MRKISGKITCTSRNTIQTGSTVNVQIIECFVDKVPNILGSICIPMATHFPILFEMSFDETSIIANKFKGMFLLCVNIQRKDKVTFINNGVQFVFEQMKLILDKIELAVNEA